MAKGRMLSKSVSLSRQLAALKSDGHRLLFSWMVAHLDAAGRMSGDPAWVRGAVVPLLESWTSKKVDAALADMERVGVIVRYTDAAGERVVAFPGFATHQAGMRPEREAPTQFGPPPGEVDPPRSPRVRERGGPSADRERLGSGPGPDHGRTDSGSGPALVREHAAEGKGREENGREGCVAHARAHEPAPPDTHTGAEGVEVFSPAPQGGPLGEADLTDDGRRILGALRASAPLRSIATLRLAEGLAARAAEGAWTTAAVLRAVEDLTSRLTIDAGAGIAPRSQRELSGMLQGFIRNAAASGGGPGRPRDRAPRVQGGADDIDAVMARAAARRAAAGEEDPT